MHEDELERSTESVYIYFFSFFVSEKNQHDIDKKIKTLVTMVD